MRKGKETGGPAFPEAGLSGLPNGEFIHGQSGMTLRDYFAAKAMNGLVAATQEMTNITVVMVAEEAYAYADAMLDARSKP